MKRMLCVRMLLAAVVALSIGLGVYGGIVLPRRERLHARLIAATYKNGGESEAVSLLKQGADANLRFNADTRKPIRSDFVTQLWTRIRGKSIEERAKSVPLLCLASAYSRHALASELLARGADVDATDGAGSTPLMYAADHNERDILLELLAAHADVNHQNDLGNTALHLAAAKINAVNCALLLEHGANPNLANVQGHTPLDDLAGTAAEVHRQWLVAYIRARAALHPASAPAVKTPPGVIQPPQPTPQQITVFSQKRINALRGLADLLKQHGANASPDTASLLTDSFELDPHEAEWGLATKANR